MAKRKSKEVESEHPGGVILRRVITEELIDLDDLDDDEDEDQGEDEDE